jgi:hypothetical protein
VKGVLHPTRYATMALYIGLIKKLEIDLEKEGKMIESQHA